MNAPTPRHLRRTEAAQWFAERGLTHVTVAHLADLADRGRGPPYSRLGRYVYYAEPDLQAWVAEALQPSTRARAPATTRA